LYRGDCWNNIDIEYRSGARDYSDRVKSMRCGCRVDAAYAGSAAVVPELRNILAGCERADSIVVNPHKWLFTPFDLSVLYTRHMDLLRRAFSLVPEYLRTPEQEKVRSGIGLTGFSLGDVFGR
jgi:aromatic-L-amino-acid decarboxylase